eukprot:scaffold38150_cov65-Phaeocystis_antarctica.AAC.4
MACAWRVHGVCMACAWRMLTWPNGHAALDSADELGLELPLGTEREASLDEQDAHHRHQHARAEQQGHEPAVRRRREEQLADVLRRVGLGHALRRRTGGDAGARQDEQRACHLGRRDGLAEDAAGDDQIEDEQRAEDGREHLHVCDAMRTCDAPIQCTYVLAWSWPYVASGRRMAVHAYRHRAVHERHHLERVRDAVESEAARPDGGAPQRHSAERDALERVGERCT